MRQAGPKVATTGRLALLWAVLVCTLSPAHAQAPPEVQLRFDLVGAELRVDPPTLVVPKNIATEVRAELRLPAAADATATAALAGLADGAFVAATLRGPQLPPVDVRVPAGTPIPIPPLALPGEYFLEAIRLERDGEVLLDGTPSEVPIEVINEVLVTSVTTRPLSLDEIRGKGIVIDEQNFDAFEFQLSLNFDGRPFQIDLPVVFPSPERPGFEARRVELDSIATEINRELLATTRVELPPELDRPGIDFSIAALPFELAGPQGDGPPPFAFPPLTGLVLIPGSVGFLNQFFSAIVMVANVAPDGSGLVVRDVTATVTLPAGDDRVPGASYDDPGDDPLRLARIEGVGVQPVQPVTQPGADGELGTADDLPEIAPGEMGDAEFLVEGLREGTHDLEFDIEAVLEGLPSGPVSLTGRALGAVVVRDPTFSVVLSHPRTVRSGESYDLFATVTNTSSQDANLVSVSLDPRAVSGAQLVSEESVRFDRLAPGESETARFELIAQTTGSVTGFSFTSDPQLRGNVSLRTGVGEREVPLAPDRIVLPPAADALPSELVTAAVRVLGQALSVASAPAGSLPDDVVFLRRSTVSARGTELAEASVRALLGEPLERVVFDLLVDWLGAREPDPGFDQLLRETRAGQAFLSAVGALVDDGLPASTLLEIQERLLQARIPDAPPLLVFAGDGADGAPVRIRVVGPGGSEVGDDPAGGLLRDLPFADVLPLLGPSRTANAVVVSQPAAAPYTVEVEATAATRLDLGVGFGTRPGAGRLLRFPAVDLPAGALARITLDLGDPDVRPSLEIDTNRDGRSDASQAAGVIDLVEGPPAIVAVRQQASSLFNAPPVDLDPAPFGLIVDVLFDKPVASSALDASRYAVEEIGVIGTALQPSGRLLRLFLEEPIGTYVPRSLQVSEVEDVRGNRVTGLDRPITTVVSDGGLLAGQVREADGSPVPGARLSVTAIVGDKGVTLASIQADREGAFDLDFVRQTGRGFIINAQHPVTLETVEARGAIRGPGARVVINPTFFGKGSAIGRVTAADGTTPVEGALVSVSPTGFRDVLTALTDALGEYRVTDVPVGAYRVTAVDRFGNRAFGAGVIDGPAADGRVDLSLAVAAFDLGGVEGRGFLEDGVTPAAGFDAYIGSYDRTTGTMDALGSSAVDDEGVFAFDGIPAGDFDVVLVDVPTGRIGVGRVQVASGRTTSISLRLEPTGEVDGIVLDAQGNPVPGALVAGGLDLATTDAQGRFLITGVPAGRRQIEAGNPVNRRRGSADVTVVAGATTNVVIDLEARATIEGFVLDAAGNPVPGATVRLPDVNGYRFVFANQQGFYRLPDLALGSYLIQAPGPPQEALIESMKRRGIDPRSAFTAGGIPPELGGDPEPTASDRNAVLRAYQNAVETILRVSIDRLEGGLEPTPGGFGWTQVDLFQDSVVEDGTLRYLQFGGVGGVALDANDLPVGAAVRVVSLGVSGQGFPTQKELVRTTTPAESGAFSFPGLVARLDPALLARTGIRAGPFTVEAAEPFGGEFVTARDELTPNAPDRTDLVLRFSGGESRGTLSGTVFLPDGTTRAPENTEVFVPIDQTGITVRTDAEGRFQVVTPIRPGTYAVTATEPLSTLRGQVSATVRAGQNTELMIRLLGLGAVDVVVERPDGTPVANANVELDRFGFPADRLAGVTDALGQVRFTNVSEGSFGVRAEEVGTGLKGRGNGTVERGASVATRVVIQGSGVVRGRFLTAATGQPVPNASVTLSGGGIQAFGTTDASGGFVLDAVPVGRFSVEAFDPATRRAGRGSGELRFENDDVTIDLVQTARGSVEGYVLEGAGTTPVAAAPVTVQAMGVRLAVSTRADGYFRVDGVPAGPFQVTAMNPVEPLVFQAQAQGRIDFEGELARVDVVLPPRRTLLVQVLDAAGGPADAVDVTVSSTLRRLSRAGTVGPDGSVRFTDLPPGPYLVEARSIAEPNDGDAGRFELVADAPETTAVLQLRGVGDVDVRVLDALGGPVGGAIVTLTANGTFTGEDFPGRTGDTLVGFTDASGQLGLSGVPFGEFFVTAEAGTVRGISTGSIQAPGAQVFVDVELGPHGSIVGRVLLEGGTTPAADALVTLRFPPQSSLQSGVLQVRSDLFGSFRFDAIPLGTFQIDASELTTRGNAAAVGSFDVAAGSGQLVDVGDLVLDASAPIVLAVTPPDGQGDVPLDSTVEVDFDEPIQLSSVSAANVQLLRGTVALSRTVTLGAGGRRLTITPTGPLESGESYTVVVRGAPDGPRNAVGLQPLRDFVSTFTAADTLAPRVLSASPGADDVGVLPDAVVRLVFSEPVDPGFGLRVDDASGGTVAGSVDLSQARTTVVFTPSDFLLANTRYTVELAGLTDVSGNALDTDLAGQPLAGAPLRFGFDTVDTVGPVLASLQLAGAPSRKEGTPVTLVPQLPDLLDVARVEYDFGGVAVPRAIDVAPFSVDALLPSGVASLAVQAVAVDAAGNRSAPALLTVPIESNLPPTLGVQSLVGPDVGAGETLRIRLDATDDVGLAELRFSAMGAVADSRVIPVGGSPAFATTIDLTVPVDAVPGDTVQVQAVARDGLGLDSPEARLDLVVRDQTPPEVRVLRPVANAGVAPGETIQVEVEASDRAGIGSVSLGCVPSLAGCGTRVLTGSPGSAREIFTLDVPSDLSAPASIALLASATDANGNAGSAPGRSLRVADTQAPTVVELSTADTRVVPGQVVALRVRATDNVGVASLRLDASGAATANLEQRLPAPLPAADVTFLLDVPTAATIGSRIDLAAVADDGAFESAPATLRLDVVADADLPLVTIDAPADGSVVRPGDVVALRISASDAGGLRRIGFATSGALVTTGESILQGGELAATATFDLALPDPLPAGLLTIEATAEDTLGSVGRDSIQVRVADATAPVVTIDSPDGATPLDPTQPITVQVSASDDVGVADLTLTAIDTETRTFTPAAPVVAESFLLSLPSFPEGAVLGLEATARDAEGNLATARLDVTLLDVVPPVVTATTPPAGATGVDPATPIALDFSERLDPASVDGTTLLLQRIDGTPGPVPVTPTLDATARRVLVTPAAPLASGASFELVATPGIRDVAGNPLAVEERVAFSTVSADTEGPRVVRVTPPDGAVGISTAVNVLVEFDEPVARSSVDASTLRLEVAGVPVPGRLVLQNGDQTVRIDPDDVLPIDSVIRVLIEPGITDPAGNGLRLADGTAATEPIATSFRTGVFSIEAPTSAGVVEGTRTQLAARAGLGLGAARVRFRVGGVEIPASGGPERFFAPFDVPSLGQASQVDIVAEALDASGFVLASDTVSVPILRGLRFEPRVVGVPVGGRTSIALVLSSPAAADVAVDLVASDPTRLGLPGAPLLIPAGADRLIVPVDGTAAGTSGLVATSPLGVAHAAISVSVPESGAPLRVEATPVGAVVSEPPTLGLAILPELSTRTLGLVLLPQPAIGATSVLAATSDPSIVQVVAAAPVPAGGQVSFVELAAASAGQAHVDLQAGGQTWRLPVVVGVADPRARPPVLDQVGVRIARAPSVGQIVVPESGTSRVTLLLLSTPATGTIPVSVTSSDPAIADVTGSPAVAAGSQSVSLDIASGSQGVVRLTIRAGNVIRELEVIVGVPPAGALAPVLAQAVGARIPDARPLGSVLVPSGGTTSVDLTLLDLAAPSPLPLSVENDASGVVSVTAPAQIASGARGLTLTLTALQDGEARLTLRAGNTVRVLRVQVGSPAVGAVGPTLAPAVGAAIPEGGSMGTVYLGVGTGGGVRLRLLDAPAPAPVSVLISSSDPQVATANAQRFVQTGSRDLNLPITGRGPGQAILTLRFGSEVRTLSVQVGPPPPGEVPPVLAPAVGAEVSP
ncbi:MAG: carboxypeptidase regulatory-like domain-containing protein [Myxococcota bacterium]|nr:carboxypeptidase regulatory-like domain-containing protein [Myxococcota bacterium]